MTNFSSLQVAGVPVMGSGFPATAGNVYFVSSVSGSSGNTGAADNALSTLAGAYAKCVANHGDIIVLLPGHAETITGAGGITVATAGVTIIGLGSYNQRPRFLMDGATTVTVAVTAADVTFRNLVFASGHLLVAACFNVTGKGCWIDQCEFTDNTTAENWGTPVKATGAAGTADGLKVTGCRWMPLIASVNALEFVEITDDIADLVVVDNTIIHEGTASPLVLQAGTKVMTRVSIQRNRLSHKMTAGDLLVNNGGSANSGIIGDNWVGNADVTGAQEGGACTGCRFFNNLYTSTATESGALEPAADTPLS